MTSLASMPAAQSALCAATPYFVVLLGAFLLSLVLTPLARDLARRLGMVDVPGGRRVNKRPIPRGGGVAVIAAFSVATLCFMAISERPLFESVPDVVSVRLVCLAVCLGALGFVDDRRGFSPAAKLAGQVAVAALAFLWCGIGFHAFAPGMPAWLDLPLTVLWIVGAINAFNLIDGLDGLASGLAVIAAAGMAGALCFTASPSQTVAHLAFIGAVLGFLRYNFSPASVFLGDTGAMFLGFFLSTVSLMTRAGDSFAVSVTVPLLAMGVPIFDTALAIVRRAVRASLRHASGDASGREGVSAVMSADADHSHHRLLRAFASQRKVAALMYAVAMFLVLVGIGVIVLRDRAAGLFIVAFLVASFVIVKDMSRVELLDVGRLADTVAHNRRPAVRRRMSALYVPFLVLADVAILVGAWYAAVCILQVHPTREMLHTMVPLRVVPPFIAIVLSRSYVTVWSRAMLSNCVRLALAVGVGALASSACVALLGYHEGFVLAFPIIHGGIALAAMLVVRFLRQFVRDCYYCLSVRACQGKAGVSRTLVFGGGLRYRAFRSELVRNSSRLRRMVVGIVDDDICMRGKVIGSVRVDGPHMDARRIVEETGADSVVIACELSPERLKVVADAFKACGVKVSRFALSEEDL